MTTTKKMTRQERLDFMRSLIVKPAEENDERHKEENSINTLIDIQETLSDVKKDILRGIK